MNTTFNDSDVIWVKKYNIDNLERYQIVTVNIEGKTVIKRIIGLPGECIQIIDGYTYINGKKLDDDYGYRTKNYGVAKNKVFLGEDQYFIMGDNRDNSMDSREWGGINYLDIKGSALIQIFPFSQVRLIKD